MISFNQVLKENKKINFISFTTWVETKTERRIVILIRVPLPILVAQILHNYIVAFYILSVSLQGSQDEVEEITNKKQHDRFVRVPRIRLALIQTRVIHQVEVSDADNPFVVVW